MLASSGRASSAWANTTITTWARGRLFTGHTGGVTAVAVGRAGRAPGVVSGTVDRTVRVWDLGTGNGVGGPFTGHTGGVTAVAVGELDGRPGWSAGPVIARCGCGTWPPAPRSATRSPATPAR